jgi:hypothetical protein
VNGPLWVRSLPWVKGMQRSCSARLGRSDSPDLYGRCELRRGHTEDHALDRGMVVVRWASPVSYLEGTDLHLEVGGTP